MKQLSLILHLIYQWLTCRACFHNCSALLGWGFIHLIWCQENKRVSVYCRHQKKRNSSFQIPSVGWLIPNFNLVVLNTSSSFLQPFCLVISCLIKGLISGLLFVPILACTFNLIKGLLFVILVRQDFCILVLYSSTRNRNTSHYFLSPICKEWVLTWDLIYFRNPRLRFMLHMSKKEKSYLEKSNQSNLLVASYKSIPKPWLLYSCKSFWNSSSYHLNRLCFF